MSATALPSTGAPAPGWAPCSDRSLERGDPLAGTAGYGERWLLVEIDGGWGEHAFFESRLDPAIGHALVRRAESAGIRPVAIRRFGRRADERRAQDRWRWALVDARIGRESVRWGSVDDPAELLDLPLDGAAGVPSDRPVLLVCTHARHDQCCAVRGRPVAQALATVFAEETWESSHLGGDRFAATMIVLPEGLSYGRVPAPDAAAIVERYLDGYVVPEFFRGRSALSNVAQAAQSYARAASGDTRIDAFAPLEQELVGAGRWRVRLAGRADQGSDPDAGSDSDASRHPDASRGPDPSRDRDASSDSDASRDRDASSDPRAAPKVVTVVLREELSAPLLSTCSATRPAAVRQFAPESISEG